MPRGKRIQRTGHLARLERQLNELDSQRHRLIAQIKSVVESLSFGSAASMAGINIQSARIGRTGRLNGSAGPRRVVSPEVRARLSKLAKERWAKAKKAGKTRLG